MSILQLVYAPNKIFQQKATPIAKVDDGIRKIVDDMFDTIYSEGGIGIGANMVGLLQQIAVVDLQENMIRNPYCFINPEITYYSEEKQTFNEASLCFQGISVDIERSKEITVSYLNYDGNPQELTASGYLATVIQHEVDYLHGKTFLDYLSPMKRNMLLKKMQKHIKKNPPHVHSSSCNH